jgi:F-type H+-transporting ATPase subunit delta
MKITREARQKAKKLFTVCRTGDGRLDASRVRTVVERIAAEKPRNYLAILSRLEKLLALEAGRTTATVESPQALGASGEEELKRKIAASFGDHFRVEFRTRPELLGGLRIKVGSDVIDGTIRGRLAALEQSL